MLKKRLQLFVIYSLGLFLIIGVFSAVIYFSVSFSENERIQQNLRADITKMLEVANRPGATVTDIQVYAIENHIYYAIWRPDVRMPVQKNLTALTWPAQSHYNRLEKIVAEDKYAEDEQIVYSMTLPFFFEGQQAQLQVINLTEQSNSMISNLTNVLVWGAIIVSMLGIGLGVMLTYLSMAPVIYAWNQQRSFVADASHELRTPLSIITLKSDQLIRHSKDSIYDHLEEINVIQQECRRMYKMVDDLLFLAKSDSGVIDLNITDFSADQLAQELKLLYDEFFETEDKVFLLDLHYHGYVLGDYEKIKQVCMIIIDNALRFTVAKNYIKLTIRLRGNRVHFEISNNGTPIKNEDLPFIFNRFYKSDTSRNKKNHKEGNGLGLSIAQEIMHAHQSKIRASLQQDSVTMFSFYLNKGKEKS